MDVNSKKSILKEKPKNLLILFVIGSLLTLTIIIIILYFGTKNLFHRFYTNEAASDSIIIGKVLASVESPVLSNLPVLKSKHGEQTKEYLLFDKRMRKYMKDFDVVKVKIFNKQHEVVYSSDEKIIGNVDKKNSQLTKALVGIVTPVFQNKDQFTDLKNETKFNVDVVETYLPIISPDNEILGAFEIYLDVTQYREISVKMSTLSSAIFGSLLLFSFLFLYLLMRRSARQISRYETVLSEMAIRDSLTGLFNRREIMNRADAEFTRFQRNAREKTKPSYKLAFIMLDIDNFKEINDVHGHLVGDQILQELAKRIKTALRQYDVLGRYGGDEFLILLVDANTAVIREVAKRVWHIVRSAPFITFKEMIHLTVSLGIATVSNKDTSINEAINRADKFLYKAKSCGRDRIQGNETC